MKNDCALGMLQFLIILCFLSVVGSNLKAQIVIPPKLEFIGLEENWSYISKDTNFIKSAVDKWSTPFWGHFPVDVYVDQEDIFILESCAAQSPYGLIDGSLVHSLNRSTGEINWIFHNNSYIGLKHREDYLNNKIYHNSNSNLEIIGYKAIDTLDKTKPAFGFYCNPVLKTIDKETGMLTQEQAGNYEQKRFYNAVGLGGTFISRNSSNQIIHHGVYQEQDSLINFRLSFNVFKIDSNMEIDSNKIYSYKYQYNDAENKSLVYYSNRSQLNDDTLILLLTVNDDADLTNSPLESKGVWLDIRDVNNIQVVKEISITDEFYRPQDGKLAPSLQLINDNIFIYQLMVPLTPPFDAKWITWLLWLDNGGRVLAKVPYIYNKEDQYSYVRAIGVVGEELYLSVSKQSATAIGMDILKIKKGGGVAEKVGTISTPQNDKYAIGNFNIVKFLPDNHLFIGMSMDYRYSPSVTTQIQYYFSFKMADIGIKTSINQTQPLDRQFTIYPIPATNNLQIDTDQIYDGISIMAANGSSMDFKTDGTNLDLSPLVSGIYIIELFNKGKSLGKQKIIKL